jgi:hypothetical protein
MEKEKMITFDEMFRVLKKVEKDYEQYLKIGQELSAIQPIEYADNYSRDMSHPLSISIRS